MKKSKLFVKGDGWCITEYTPTLFKLFRKNYEKMTLQRYIRFAMEWVRKYKVYYLEIDGEDVAYSVISKGGVDTPLQIERI